MARGAVSFSEVTESAHSSPTKQQSPKRWFEKTGADVQLPGQESLPFLCSKFWSLEVDVVSP